MPDTIQYFIQIFTPMISYFGAIQLVNYKSKRDSIALFKCSVRVITADLNNDITIFKEYINHEAYKGFSKEEQNRKLSRNLQSILDSRKYHDYYYRNVYSVFKDDVTQSIFKYNFNLTGVNAKLQRYVEYANDNKNFSKFCDIGINTQRIESNSIIHTVDIKNSLFKFDLNLEKEINQILSDAHFLMQVLKSLKFKS